MNVMNVWLTIMRCLIAAVGIAAIEKLLVTRECRLSGMWVRVGWRMLVLLRLLLRVSPSGVVIAADLGRSLLVCALSW